MYLLFSSVLALIEETQTELAYFFSGSIKTPGILLSL
jgi:hypothetical protein